MNNLSNVIWVDFKLRQRVSAEQWQLNMQARAKKPAKKQLKKWAMVD